jgi:hypothetical protein
LGIDFDAFAQSADLGGAVDQALNASGAQLRHAFRTVGRASKTYASTGVSMSFGPAEQASAGGKAAGDISVNDR